jgi:hypothetical protein
MAVRGGWRLTTVLMGAYLCSNEQQVAAQTPNRCVLAGAVVNSVSNVGIPHALVSYSGPASGYRFTDAGGNFRVENLPCMGYSITVSKAGFVSGQDESTQPSLLLNTVGRALLDMDSVDQPGQPPKPARTAVYLKPGSEPTQISLVPVSSIIGMVLDENSEPLAGVSVQGIAVKPSLSGTDYVPAQTARTDDRGHFSLLGLTPGDYVVRLAGEASSTRYFVGTNLNLNNDHRGIPPVYYPNVDSLASASVLHLLPGEEANADFQQATEAAFDINGRFSNFAPQSWTQVQLYRDGDRLPVGSAYVNLSSGQFRMVDVPRGSYTLRVVQYHGNPEEWFAAEVPVMVTSQPLQNLVIELSSGADVPVTVSYEAGAQPDGIVRLILQPQHTRANVRRLSIGKGAEEFQKRFGNPNRSEQATGSKAALPSPIAFTNVIPDKYRLSVETGGGIGYVASAKLGDLDVLHGEFPLSGSVLGELHVTIRGDSASVQGQVNSAGQPAIGAQVYLIPTSGGGAGLKFGFCDEEGHYTIVGVPPGDYRIRAWKGQPAAKEILAGTGETLTLQPSERRTVTLEATPGSDALEQKPPL